MEIDALLWISDWQWPDAGIKNNYNLLNARRWMHQQDQGLKTAAQP